MPNLVFVDIRKTEKKLFKRNQPWYWVALSGDNNRVLGQSSETYTNRQDCIDAATLLFGDQANVYLRQAEQGNQTLRLSNANIDKLKSFPGRPVKDNPQA